MSYQDFLKRGGNQQLEYTFQHFGGGGGGGGLFSTVLCSTCSQLDLVLKETDLEERVAAAKAKVDALQGKFDFYVNDV